MNICQDQMEYENRKFHLKGIQKHMSIYARLWKKFPHVTKRKKN